MTTTEERIVKKISRMVREMGPVPPDELIEAGLSHTAWSRAYHLLSGGGVQGLRQMFKVISIVNDVEKTETTLLVPLDEEDKASWVVLGLLSQEDISDALEEL